MDHCEMTWLNQNVPQIFVKKGKNEENILINVFIIGGHIMSSHIDNSGSGHDLSVLYGAKLVLFWEPSEEVLKDYKFMHELD